MARLGALALSGLLACGAGFAGAASTVYRCGDDGRSYSQQPCRGGQVLAVEDPRSAQERSDGETAAARQSRAAELLVRERREREGAVPRAASLGRSRSGDPTFTPTAPGSAGRKAGGPSTPKKRPARPAHADRR
jgi:hypothetical protein